MAQRGLKIGIIDTLGGHGGFHYYTDGLARGLSNAGTDVVLYTSDHTKDVFEKNYTSKNTFGTIYSNEKKIKRAIRFIKNIIKTTVISKIDKVDFLHFHFFHYRIFEFLMIFAAKTAGLGVIITLHDIESFGGKSTSALRTLIVKMADGLVVHNSFSRVQLLHSSGVKLSKVAVIPHGHYADYYCNPPSRRDARKKLNLSEDTFIFLFFGNSRLEKGLDLLIEAAGNLPRSTDWLLLIAGKMTDVQFDIYKEKIKIANLLDNSRIDVGLVSEEDTACYFRSADIVVVPYRKIYESGVVIMAHTFEKPVLASDLPPLIDAVAEPGGGIMFANGDVVSLQTALAAAMNNHFDLAVMGVRGRENVLKTRDWNEIARQTIKFANQVFDPQEADQ